MITAIEAASLRHLIEVYRDAEIADSFKGGGDPADWAQIEYEAKTAKHELEVYIANLTERN